jgi:phage I-like protein
MSYRFNRRRALFNREVLAQPIAANPAPAAPDPAPPAAFPTPADGWYQLAPTGEHEHPESGLAQVLDDTALDAIVRRFEADSRPPNFAGLLVDFDHFSYSPGQSSQAAGWIVALERRADGLWARIRWSSPGAAAVASGAYRFLSPVWLRADTVPLGENRVRPLRLDSAGLTNTPNLKGLTPLSNRAAGVRPPNPTHMKLITTLMGLPADASEDALGAAITALQQRAAAAEQALQEALAAGAPLKNRLAELEGASKPSPTPWPRPT